MSDRASIFESSADFDISEFTPKKASPVPTAPAEAIRAVAEETDFVSREAPKQRQSISSKKKPRRYRTGRNVQVNIKALQDTVDRFNAIVDGQKWVTGYVLERAVAALERELNLGTDASHGKSGREGQE